MISLIKKYSKELGVSGFLVMLISATVYITRLETTIDAQNKRIDELKSNIITKEQVREIIKKENQDLIQIITTLLK